MKKEQITLIFPSGEKNKNQFLQLLPIFKKEGEIYTVDFDKLAIYAHCREKYKISTNNSNTRKESSAVFFQI